jgi:hypothetical protein
LDVTGGLILASQNVLVSPDRGNLTVALGMLVMSDKPEVPHNWVKRPYTTAADM